jgi:primosomal protein N' (replication factor Y)
MNYYQIALPIKIDQLYTYRTPEVLEKGCRVLVSFQFRVLTGFVWQKISETELPKGISIKKISHIVDYNPILPPDLLKLAEWMSSYYFVSPGVALSAMLPTGLQVQSQSKIRRHPELPLQSSSNPLLMLMTTYDWYDVKELKKTKITRLFEKIEELEKNGLIEVQRTFDKKVKKRRENYILMREVPRDIKLTPKQKAAIRLFESIGDEFPVKLISNDVSYSILKALRTKGLLEIQTREFTETNIITPVKLPKKLIKLTNQQQTIVNDVGNAIDLNLNKNFLLYGVTGSGKTEVYINLIRKVLKQNKTAIMLVPEISLTPQMVSRFYSAFDEEIAILHSHLNEREKYIEWKKMSSDACRIVIGARSAIFAPLKNIGLIIVDEEHESSYKQENNPRYQARDIATVRAKFHNAVTLLGSATPSLESWYNTEIDKYDLHKMMQRPGTTEMPSVKIIDMRNTGDQLFSEELVTLINDRIEKKEQIILFLNRRGYSSFLQCTNCGQLFKCPDCDISLSYHKSNNTLKCHYCGHQKETPRSCPNCNSFMFSYGAAGTQQVEQLLNTIFPEANVRRMDADTTTAKDSYRNMFEEMQSGKIDILLGTQMIAKGLDFPNVTLVGILNADISMNIPDFRAQERTFQLITQVAGRAGRSDKKGDVIIQTFNPEHYAIQYACRQNFDSFAIRELEQRELLGYPPYSRMARILFATQNEKKLVSQILPIHKLCKSITKALKCDDELTVLGPVQTPFYRIQDKYRIHIVIKSKSFKMLNQWIKYFRANVKLPSTIQVNYDIDPFNLL